MPVFNQSRSKVIQIIFVVVFLIIIGQLINLQLFSAQLKIDAKNNAIFRKVVYPNRGIIYDRNKKAILENITMYDLVVTPSEARGVDTMGICNLLGIDTAEYKKRMRDIIFKNTSVRPSVFEPLLSQEMYGRVSENIYKYQGFILQERSVRSYPYNTAPHVLGYIGEVDPRFLKDHKDEGYEMGDYTGLTGLERSYEKVLMGQRGVHFFLRDNRSRIQGPYEKGIFDTAEVAGRALYTSLDVDVQQLGEKLLQNKIGSAVAINPKTGGIIAMVSSPGYGPNSLTGNTRRKNFSRMFLDTVRPLMNRAIQGQYPPGSTFKPLGGLVALDEGLITPAFGYPCFGAYTACGKPVRCTHAGHGHAANLRIALANSCNSYFTQVFRMAIDNPKFRNPQEGYLKWKEYMNAFGLGVKTGIDIPGEVKGSIPDTARYNRDFGGFARWKSCNLMTLGIGQDRMTATPLQLANMMCIIANKGYYYTPHFVDSIESESIDDTVYMAKYRKKHEVTHIHDSVYQAVHNGMNDVTIFGTAAQIKIPGVEYCAKTGTAQNPHGKNHAVFVAFAPKDNPKIAVAVVVENSGYGGTWAGPVAAYMIEKYLNDTLSTASVDKIDKFSKVDLIPAAIKRWYYVKDSIKAARDRVLIDEKTEVVNNVENRKTTFDPEAEPNRKDTGDNSNDTTMILHKSPFITPDTKKQQKDKKQNGKN